MGEEIPRLHFHRFEFKYIVSGELLARIERELSLRMERDRHSGEDGSYFIRSIYFDTDAFAWHAEKKAGLFKRYKYRLRTYRDGQHYSDPIFLELKGRSDVLVYKHRQVLDSRNLEALLSAGMGTLCTAIAESNRENRVGQRFVFDVFRMRLSPSVVVDYNRTDNTGLCRARDQIQIPSSRMVPSSDSGMRTMAKVVFQIRACHRSRVHEQSRGQA